MEAIIPYLNFNGKAAQPLEFYAVALDGKVVQQQTFGGTSMAQDESMKDNY